MAAKAPEEEYGGYDYEFVEKVPDRFVCNTCTKVQRDPRLTLCCGQHFCQSCLENWFKKHGKKSCPHCREKKDFNHVLNKEKKREIGELKIHCTLRQEGCQWVGELDSLQTHLKSESGCGYVEVSCTNKCGKIMKRKDLKSHLADSCSLRKYKCEYCSHEDTYQAITGKGYHPLASSHYDTCPNYPLPCPNKCGESNIKRKDMSAHRETCPLEEVNCTNECKEKPTYPGRMQSKVKRMKRKDLQQHLTKECPLRKYKCEHCGHEDTYQAITGDTGGSEYQAITTGGMYRISHYNVCPNFPLDCPNRCGTRAILRKDMSDHRTRCPLQPVECPFKKAGCVARVVRKDYDEHMASNTQQHLLQTFQTQQRMIETLQDECKKRDSIAEESYKKFQMLKAGVSYYMGPLLKTCTQEQKLPLKCIQSLLDEPNQLWLKENRDSLTITMPEFSQYKRSGKVWQSPPFYYGAGYKMCLAVYANGTGAGAGTHVSVSLLLLRGEFNDRLKWPMGGNGHEIEIQLLKQKQEAGRQREPSVTISLCLVCPHSPDFWSVIYGEDSRVVESEEKLADHQTVQQYKSYSLDSQVVRSEEKLADHQTVQQYKSYSLHYDSIVLRVSLGKHYHDYDMVEAVPEEMECS